MTKLSTMQRLGATLKQLSQGRQYLLLLALLSTLLFWLSWPPNYGAPLLLVALVPLLFIEQHVATHVIERPVRTFYKWAYGTMFLWNLATNWWVGNATIAGALFMLIVNSACMSAPLLLFFWTKKQLGQKLGYLSLIVYWLSLEYLHLNWELSFPWLNLGNGFACWPSWVQWYAYTGALGGTLWILVANIGLYEQLKHVCAWSKPIMTAPSWCWWRRSGIMALWIILPVIHSNYVYQHYQEQGEPVEVAVMQVNIDPYTGRFVDTEELLSMEENVERFITLSESQLTPETQFLVWPEGAIDLLFDEQILKDYILIDRLIQFRQRYPQLSLITGINSVVNYDKKATKTTRFSERHGYYDLFNTALFVGNDDQLATYHKSKLVPGAELVPFFYSITLPEFLTAGMGSTLRSLGGLQSKPHAFFNAQGIGVGPSICYESIYGEHLAKFIRAGASLLFSITIDGWWHDTPGYQQHFHYTRLRAIESRRSIAQSAQRGTSGFINQRGDVLQATAFSDQAVLRHSLKANTGLTFYVRHGNYLARIAVVLAGLLLLAAVVRSRYMAS